MDIGAFDDSLLDPQRDTDNLANLLQEKEFRYLSDPSYGTPTEYPRNYGHLNSPISVCFWLSHSPTLPSLNYSSPGSSQGYSEYAQVQHQSTLVIKHYNPYGRPATMRNDSDPSRSEKFICQECFQITSTQSNLDRHMKKHSNNREKFVCHVCPKDFTSKFNLNRHIITFHE
ncbi:hypothetical protein CLU79DRAFT_128677 [Phycomyces nitens]|nr:hypothetical protein CLU79DRAFT_128601 [Phycomyces nitens]KAI9023622.1 hypothetical protein CLU79DRAFT_128677 [Phycomyces nitens]